MIRSRNIRLAAVVVLGAAVAVSTTACGGPMQAGAAAVIQGDRTTDAQVQSQVAQIQSVAEKYGVASSYFSDAKLADLSRAQVNLALLGASVQRAADDLGVSAGADQDAAARSAIISDARKSIGGNFPGGDIDAVVLDDLSNFEKGTAVVSPDPDTLRTLVHAQALYVAIQKALAAKDGANADATTVQNEASALLAKAATEIKVKISPRYGTFDAATGAIVVPVSQLHQDAAKHVVVTGEPWLRLTDAQIAQVVSDAQQQQQQSQGG